MTLLELHNNQKEVSVAPLFKGELGTTSAIQLQKDGRLAEHITKTPALLICIEGHVTFENENNQKISLKPGDYVLIEPNVKHWLHAFEKSQLLLLK